MGDPFEQLGIKKDATAKEIRRAYHLRAREFHPDKFQDPEKQAEAENRMTELNLAYQEALRQCEIRKNGGTAWSQQLPAEEAVKLSAKMLAQDYAAGALRELMRSETKPPIWFHQQGHVLMKMEQYETALQSYREAVKREPANNEFRRSALAAEMALKESRSLRSRMKRLFGIPVRRAAR